ncbi:MAG: 30S ribosomal protein S20 [Phycisphaerae bacterium]
MPQSKSAEKRMRQDVERRARNRSRKAKVKSQVKVLTTAVAAGDFATAEQEFRKASSMIEKVAAKGTIHKNASARQRSRLARKLNAAKAAGAGTSA